MYDDNLNSAIALSRSGKKSEARELLKEILRSNPQNETAWLWFADTFTDIRNRIAALEECLRFNPNCQTAQRGLAALKIEEARTARATPLEKSEIRGGKIAPPYDPVSKPISSQNLSQKLNTKQKSKNNRPYLFLVSAFGIILLFGLCIFGAWILQKQRLLLVSPVSNLVDLTPTRTVTSIPSTLTPTIIPTATTQPATVQDWVQEVLPKALAYQEALGEFTQLNNQAVNDILTVFDPLWKADIVFALDKLDEAGLSLTNITSIPPGVTDVNRWMKLVGEETQSLSVNYRLFLDTYDGAYLSMATVNMLNISSYLTRASEELEKLQ